MTNTEAIKTAREALRKQAVFIMEWMDCLVGVQMSADDFASDCGSKEYKQALAALDSLFVEPGDERIKLECADRVEAEFRVMVANPDIDNLDAIRKLRFKQVAQLRAAIMGSNPAGN